MDSWQLVVRYNVIFVMFYKIVKYEMLQPTYIGLLAVIRRDILLRHNVVF